MANRIVYIYGLVDPRDGHFKYVGKTTNARKRLNNHLQPRQLAKNNPRTAWLKHLLSLGLKPTMVILDEIDEEHWEERERYWIKYFSDIGYELKNSTTGGEGLERGHKMPEGFGANLSRKLSGRAKGEEHKKHISEALTGQHKPESQRTVLSVAKQGRSYNKRAAIQSKYIGVCWRADKKRWIALIKPSPQHRQIRLGSSKDEEVCARMYDAAALHYFGPTARLNFPVL